LLQWNRHLVPTRKGNIPGKRIGRKICTRGGKGWKNPYQRGTKGKNPVGVKGPER